MSNSDIWDVLLTICLLLLAVAVTMLFERYSGVKREVLTLRSEIAARKAHIAAPRASTQIPGVDAHARTTVRDTDDLPRTGRMTQGVKRVKTDARPDNDRGLPERLGPPTAQVGGTEGSDSPGNKASHRFG